MKFYQATVKINEVVDTKEGPKTKSIKETYLVEAVSVTDVEAKINVFFKDVTFEFEVASVSETKIKEILR
ncbi:MAG: DUF4494 family protein [Candidatus Woesearchaeota archaeon]|jgi:hypothetical protein